MVTAFLAPTSVGGQGLDEDAFGVISDRIHERRMSGINGDNGQRSLFNPDGFTMCPIVLRWSVSDNGPERCKWNNDSGGRL